MHPLTLAMTPGARLSALEEPVVHSVQEIGRLYLPTGNVVACDPFCAYTPVAFAPKLSEGHYPVYLSIVDYDGKGHGIALAILRISNGEPVRWEMAKSGIQGRDFNIFAPHGIYRYSVDYAN